MDLFTASKQLLETEIDGKTQWWKLKIEAESFHLKESVNFDSWPFFYAMKRIKEMNDWSRIVATPLTGRRFNDDIDGLSIRGCGEDENPFIVRKRAIPEFYATIVKGSQGKIFVSLHNTDDRNGLTEGQRKWIHEKFDDQLKACWSMELIQCLKGKALNDNFARIQTQLNKVEYSIQRFREDIIARREEFVL